MKYLFRNTIKYLSVAFHYLYSVNFIGIPDIRHKNFPAFGVGACLVRTFLHQRNMLMSRSMINYVGPIGRKDLVHTVGIPHRNNQHRQIEWEILSGRNRSRT